MSDRYVEKSFLYLLAFSLLLHVALFAAFIFLPERKVEVRQEPVMIDLEDLPDLKETPAPTERPARRQAERRERVQREMAPKGEREQDRFAFQPSRPVPAPRQPAASPQRLPPSQRGGEAGPPSATGRGGDIPVREAPQGGGVLKPRGAQLPEMAQLMPNAQRMAKLEEGYRKKYSAEVAEGDTKFLDTDDIQFGSFLHRFENSIYGVWRYPQEAARLGVEGVTPVKITFNNRGEIEKFEILQSSGSRILDGEVERTLRLVGPVGPFPKGYTKDKFNLIAFFQYGIVRGSSRGTLH
ncbi:TonB family protein [Geobacter pickeringii]|uniref:TonB-dependent receptor n=1 Tax=Geobacter pickeringii TaxID=345632 RepID=A0A0B5BHL6_9BACT|nr:TonB family protein [Geobacter pickeringii]AJE03970.1 TonB-dependent receptor [Geobacter pickeringii]